MNKEILTEDVLLNLQSYINLADAYVQENLHSKEVLQLGLLIDKMQEEMYKVIPHYETLSHNCRTN